MSAAAPSATTSAAAFGNAWEYARENAPYLEILFGPGYDIVPALVLTRAAELFEFVRIGRADAVLPVCSGDMLFNVFDEYLHFLS